MQQKVTLYRAINRENIPKRQKKIYQFPMQSSKSILQIYHAVLVSAPPPQFTSKISISVREYHSPYHKLKFFSLSQTYLNLKIKNKLWLFEEKS